jgi:hypothetical protein
MRLAANVSTYLGAYSITGSRSNHHLGESAIEKLTNKPKSLVGGNEMSHPLKKPVKHPLSYIKARIHSRSDRPLYEADRIVKQYLVVTDMHEDRGQGTQAGVEWRLEPFQFKFLHVLTRQSSSSIRWQ